MSGDPELVAKNECVDALFSTLTGSDPYLNDALRSGIELSLSDGGGAPASLDDFVRRAMEFAAEKGLGPDDFGHLHVNLRERAYEPLWLRNELIDGLKPMTGLRKSILVVSGLREAVRRALPKRRRGMSEEAAMAEAQHYIDSLSARFAAHGCKMSILYLD
jgi:hypothetical protein